MKNRPKAPQSIISKSRHLKQLLSTGRQHQRILSQITHILESSLPGTGLAEHCVSAHLENGHLRLFTDSSVWASRFRFQSKMLQQVLNKQNYSVSAIDVRVIPPTSYKIAPARKETVKKISPATASSIVATAHSLSDEKLKAALERLAKSATANK